MARGVVIVMLPVRRWAYCSCRPCLDGALDPAGERFAIPPGAGRPMLKKGGEVVGVSIRKQLVRRKGEGSGRYGAHGPL